MSSAEETITTEWNSAEENPSAILASSTSVHKYIWNWTHTNNKNINRNVACLNEDWSCWLLNLIIIISQPVNQVKVYLIILAQGNWGYDAWTT